VRRDGSWINDDGNRRSVHRNDNHLSDLNNNIGFRVVPAPSLVGKAEGCEGVISYD
jgi:hypothetical protein